MAQQSNSARSSGASSRPRHPSAGNLNERPILVDAAADNAGSIRAFPGSTAFDPRGVRIGPGLDDEMVDRLIGHGLGDGKRVLELGCGNGSNAVSLARRGARVIVVDSSSERLAVARRNAEAESVRVEFHHGDLADLAFVRADQIDLCLAVYSLAEVEDLSRVFRQVERVLRTEAPLLISLPHPLELMSEFDTSNNTVRLTRSAFDETPIAGSESGTPLQPHRITDVFTALSRSNFRVDTLLEPPVVSTDAASTADPLHHWIPATVVLRGRKQGI